MHATKETDVRETRIISGCAISIGAFVLALVILGTYGFLWASGRLQREPSIVAKIEPDYVVRIHEDSFSASGTGSGGGNVIFYRSDEPFDVVARDYVSAMAERGYSVNPSPIGTSGFQFTRDPNSVTPKVCYYLEPYPADVVATHLSDGRLENLLAHYDPTYTISYWEDWWGFPFSGGIC